MRDTSSVNEKLFHGSDKDIIEVETFDMEVDYYKKRHKAALFDSSGGKIPKVLKQIRFTTIRVEISGIDQIDFFDYPIHQN